MRLPPWFGSIEPSLLLRSAHDDIDVIDTGIAGCTLPLWRVGPVKPFLTCYIEGTRDGWEAHCVDFDISVTGRALQETKDRLETVVRSYIADAMNEPEPARARLLNRRSPWTTRLAWRLRVAFSALGSKTKTEFEGGLRFLAASELHIRRVHRHHIRERFRPASS